MTKLSFKTLFLILILLLIPTVFLLRLNQKPPSVAAEWFSDSWAYRQTINIAPHDVGETNVYITVTINIGTATKAQADDGDFRFTDQYGELLQYYISSNAGSTAPSFHVLIPSFPFNPQTFYAYYGNPSASNGFNTSDFTTAASAYAVNSYGTEEKSPGPTAWYKFDEGYGFTANNSGIGLTPNGTFGAGASAPTWKPEENCLSGKCLFFDGIDDYISTGTINLNTPFSFSFWAKPQNPNSFQGIFGGPPGNNYINLESDQFHFWGSSHHYTPITSDANWHQFTMTHSGTTVYLYFDGKQIDSYADNDTTFVFSQIGRFWDGGDYTFQGSIDELKIYSYVRSATQVQADFNAKGSSSSKGNSAVLGSSKYNNHIFTDGLVGYWKMDESSWNGSNNEIIDYSVTNNSGIGKSGATTSTGKYGNAGIFDGSNDYAKTMNNTGMTGNPNFTMAGWFNTDDTGDVAGNTYLYVAYQIGVWNAGTGLGAQIEIMEDKIVFDGYSSGAINYTPPSSIAGQWIHVAVVNIGTSVSMYINGTKVGTNSSAFNLTNAPAYFGASNLNGSPGRYFKGKTDEVRLFNRALSDREISQLSSLVPDDYWSPGPVGYWNMDEPSGNVNDTSGNNNLGTATGTSSKVGKYGKARNFINSTDEISVTDSTSINMATSVTVEAWIKFDKTIANQTNSYPIIVLKRPWLVGGYGLMVNKPGNNILFQWNWSGGYDNPESTTSFVAGQWYHIVGTLNGSVGRIYVNGVMEDQHTVTTPMALSTGTNLTIGNDGADTNVFEGSIDEVKLYNYARTNKQIIEDMNAGHPFGGSPVGSQIGYWKFDEGLESTLNDTSITHANGTKGSSVTWSNNGKYGKALSFPADTNSYVNVTNNSYKFAYNQPFSVSVWANKTEDSVSYASLFSQQAVTGNYYNYGIQEDGANRMCANLSKYLVGSNSICSPTTVPLGIWNHYTSTFDGTTITLYINAVKIGTTTYTYGNLPSPNGSAYIGNDSAVPSNRGWKGLIDEVKVYNAALTPDEVKIEYNHGQALVLGSTSLNSGDTASSNSSLSEYCVPGDTSTCSPPITELNFEQGTGSTAFDTSGNSKHVSLALGISSPSWTTGKSGKGLTFDGNDYARTISNSGIAGSAPWTMQGWFNTDDTGDVAGNYYLYTGIQLGVWNGGGLGSIINVMEDRIQAESYSGGYMTYTPPSPINGQWVHVAVTHNGGALKLYVNGIQITTATYTLNLTANYAWIGSYNNTGTTPGRNFKGKIDQVRLYDYARSPIQIAWDYNRGGPTCWFKLDECQGSAVNNAADIGKTGTITIGAGGTQTSVGTCAVGAATAWGIGASGKFGSSVNFDGTDDTLSTGSAYATTYSLAFWAKPSSIGTSLSALTASAFVSIASTGIVTAPGFTSPTVYVNGSINAPIRLNQWNHIVVTTATAINANAINLAKFSSTYFRGQIDDFRLYGYTLNPTQIKTIYNENSSVRFGPQTGSP